MLALLAAVVLVVDPVWLDGPTAVPGAPAGRNPALAAGGGVVHAVYRARDGGVAHLVAGTGAAFAGAAVIPGSMGAAVQGNKNYPALAVDAAGVGHIAWAPPSGPGNGASFVRIGGDGGPLAPAVQVTAKWIESIAVGVTADEVHVLVTAIKEMEQPDTLDGVFNYRGPLAGGLVEEEAWQYPNFAELSVALAPWGGLAVLARWDVMKRIDLMNGWTNFKNVELPAGVTSVGRPQHGYAGEVELWATIGWVDATPVNVSVRSGGPKQPWTVIGEGVFDPEGADGEPAVALGAGDGDERMVAWLAADGARLRVALGTGAWGQAAALAGTENATSFAAVREEAMAYRVVFADAAGVMYAGRVGVEMAEATTGSGSTSGGSSEEGSTTIAGTGSSEGSTGVVVPTSDVGTTAVTSLAGETTSGAGGDDAEASGCGCAATQEAPALVAGIGLWLRRSRRPR